MSYSFVLLSNLLSSNILAFVRSLWDKSYWNPLWKMLSKKIEWLFDWLINHYEDFFFFAKLCSNDFVSHNVPFSFPLNLFFIKTIFHTLFLCISLLCSLFFTNLCEFLFVSATLMHSKRQLPVKGADHRVTWRLKEGSFWRLLAWLLQYKNSIDTWLKKKSRSPFQVIRHRWYLTVRIVFPIRVIWCVSAPLKAALGAFSS